MKRKLIALVLAIMLVGSCVGAMAAVYDRGDINTNLQSFYNEFYGDKTWDEFHGYLISEEGIYIVYDVYNQYFDKPAVGSERNSYYDAWEAAGADRTGTATAHLRKEAVAPYVKVAVAAQPKVVPITAHEVVLNEQGDIEAAYPGYDIVYTLGNQYLLFDGVNYILVTIKTQTETPDIDGQPTTGPDDFDLKYSSYDGTVISAFSFKPAAFGNGVTFSHAKAKSLFSITVKYESKLVIQLRDAEGRLYPVSGATYSAADNGYVATLKADESKTFGWYGTDGAGYHKAGSLANPATITLDLNVWATTTGKNADGTPWASERADMRFDYIVKHGDAAHDGNYSGSSSNSPKTGDARMAYLTLASLVVLAGVAVIITRKLRTNA